MVMLAVVPVIPLALSEAMKTATSAISASVMSDRRVPPLPGRAARRGAAERAHTRQHPAGVRLLSAGRARGARPYGLLVLTLQGDAIAAITSFADPGVFRHFGLPRTLPSPERSG